MSDEDTNGFSNAFDEHIRSISKQVLEEEFAKRQICEEGIVADPEALNLQQRLHRIMCKEFISAKEAAVLLNCSERHIHNLVDRARRPYTNVGKAFGVACREAGIQDLTFHDLRHTFASLWGEPAVRHWEPSSKTRIRQIMDLKQLTLALGRLFTRKDLSSREYEYYEYQ